MTTEMKTRIGITAPKKSAPPRRCRALFIAILSPLLLVFVPLTTTANAKEKWSDIEIRGIKPGMTFKAVESLIKTNWPNAKVKVRYHTLKHNKNRYEYGAYIEVKDQSDKGRETLKIEFLAPTSLDVDKKNATVKRISRDQDRRQDPLLRATFVEQLKGKYGPPTLETETNLKWMFDKDMNVIRKPDLTAKITAKKQACSDIQQQRRAFIKTMINNGKTPRENNEIHKAYLKSERTCQDETAALNNCLSSLDYRTCPYSLHYGWTTSSSTKGFVPGFGALLYGIPLDKQQETNIKTLEEALMKKALEDTKAKADANSKADL